jgi:hypothetical protein
MSDRLDSLILDLLEWIDRTPRTYAEVMDAWRTSCPRLTVWEDAVDRGYVVRQASPTGELAVVITPAGRSFLTTARRAGSPAASATAAGA